MILILRVPKFDLFKSGQKFHFSTQQKPCVENLIFIGNYFKPIFGYLKISKLCVNN